MPNTETGLRHTWRLNATEYFREIRKLRAETKEFDGESRKATDSAGRGYDRVSDSLERTGGAVSRLKGRIVGIFAAFSVTRILGELFKLNAGLETTTKQFEQMAGGVDNAKKLIGELRAFTASTPFQEGEVFGAARNLLAFGFDPDKIGETLRRLGDVSAGLKIPLGELAEIYGKIRVQGRLFQEDINQLQGRGIPIVTALADQFGVTEAEVRKLVETGQVGFENIELAFRRLTDVGGIFAGLTAQLSTTAEGLISTLRDLIARTAQEVGAGAFELIKEDIEGIVTAIQRARENGQATTVIDELSQALAGLYRTVRSGAQFLIEHGALIAKLLTLLAAWRAGMILVNGAAVLMSTGIRTAQAVLGIFAAGAQLARAGLLAMTGQTVAAGVAMRTFTAIVRTNPIGLIVSVVLTAVTAFTLFRDKTDELADAQRDLKSAVDENIKALGDLSGAAIRSRDADLFREVAQLGRERADIAADIARRERALREITPRSGQDALNDVGNVSGRIEQFRQLSGELEELRRKESDVLFRINQANRERDAIQEELNKSLTKQLGYLEQIREELIAQNGEGQIAGRTLAGVNAEIASLQARIEALRNAGGEGGATFTVIDREAERKLERFGELVAKIADEIKIAAGATDEQRSAIRELIDTQRQLEAVQAGLSDSTIKLSTEQRKQSEAAVAFLEKRVEELRKQSEAFGEAARLTLEAGRALETVAPNLAPGAGRLGIAGAVDEQVRLFEAQSAELLALKEAGAITEEAFRARASAAAEAFRDRLSEILALLRAMGLVSDEAIEAIVRGFSRITREAKTHAEAAGEISIRYGQISQAIRGVGVFGRAFGVLNQDTQRLIESADQLFDSLQRVQDAQRKLNDLAKQANPSGEAVASAQAASFAGTIGAVTAVAGVIGGLVNTYIEERRDRRAFLEAQREEMRRLAGAMRDAARGFEQTVRQLFSGIVGRDITGSQAGQAQIIVSAIESELARIREAATGPRGTINQTFIRDRANAAGIEALLSQLEGVGIDAFENIGDIWETILEASGGDILAATRKLIEGFTDAANGIDFQGIESIIQNLIENLGASSETVDGFLTAFQTLIGFIDNDARTSFDDFLNGLRALGADVLGPELLDQLNQIAGADLSTQSGRNQLRALLITIMESVFAGGSALLGNVTAEDLQRIIETLVGFVDQADAEAASAAGGETVTSRSVQIGRAITEVQANEFIAFAEDQAFTLREIRDLIRFGNQLTAALIGFSGIRNASLGASFDFRGSQFGVVTPDIVRAFSAEFGAQLLRASSNVSRTSASFAGRQ